MNDRLMHSHLSRRTFLRSSTLAGTGLLVLGHPRLSLGAQSSNALRVAAIGIGGQGRGNIDNVANCGAAIVALCDVDPRRAGDVYQKFPQAKRFTDFRRMLDAMDREIDAVIVSTPDHTHAVAVLAAMKRGKHVYCEKPLTRTVREARVLRETARATQVVTQMGNQGSASGGLRRAVDFAWGGVLGEIREAHVWFHGGNGPQKRPTDTPAVPEQLDWNQWLGPAEERPYHPAYLPASWRGWRAFGSGIVGDFGCHTANIMFRALRLEQLWNFSDAQKPERVVIRVEAKPSEADAEGYPRSMSAVVDLPARGALPPVQLTVWAKERPSADLTLGYPLSDWGDLLVGSKGTLLSECPWNTRYVLLPETKFDGFKAGPPETLPRSPGHHKEWVEACQGRGKTFSGFEIGGPLTELMQLVNLATLVPGPLEYDTVSGRILNSEPAQQLVHRPYRAGWSL